MNIQDANRPPVDVDTKRLYRQFRKSHIIDGDYTTDVWSYYIEKLMILDQKWLSLRKLYIFIWFLLASTIAIYVHKIQAYDYFINYQDDDYLYLNIMVFMGAVYSCVLFVFLLLFKSLPPEFKNLFIPLIAVLSQDVDFNKTINIKMDVRSGKKRAKFISSNIQYISLSRTKRVRCYHSVWFNGHTQLCDGNIIAWQVQDYVHEIKSRKLYFPFKFKTKISYRVKRKIDCSLSYKKNNYCTEQVPEVLMKEKDNRSILKYRLVERRIVLKPVFKLNDLLSGISVLYQGLKPLG